MSSLGDLFVWVKDNQIRGWCTTASGMNKMIPDAKEDATRILSFDFGRHWRVEHADGTESDVYKLTDVRPFGFGK